MTWKQRVTILRQAACATSYLHSSSPPYVHRDIKRYGSIAGSSVGVYAEYFLIYMYHHLSNNILLDGTLNAYLADLGFMMALPIDYGSSCIVTSAGAIGMAGTRGYLAPEYGAGKVGPKCDVFSFGIVSDVHVQVLSESVMYVMMPVAGVFGDLYWSTSLFRRTRRGKLGM